MQFFFLSISEDIGGNGVLLRYGPRVEIIEDVPCKQFDRIFCTRPPNLARIGSLSR